MRFIRASGNEIGVGSTIPLWEPGTLGIPHLWGTFPGPHVPQWAHSSPP